MEKGWNMNKRLEVLRKLVWTVIYLGLLLPLWILLPSIDSLSSTESTGLAIAIGYSVPFAFSVGHKISEWLFKGIDK